MEPVNVDPLKFDIIFIWIVGGDLYTVKNRVLP